MYYYCNCKKNNLKSTGKYRQVKADKEGVCLDCGYYAVAFTKDQDSIEIFSDLRIEEKKGDNYYIGEGLVHAKAEKVDLNLKPEFNPSKRKSTGRKPTLTFEQKKEVEKLLPKYTQGQIAKVFNVGVGVIKKVAKDCKFNYNIKSKSKLTIEQKEEIKNLLGKVKQKDIAKKYGVGRGLISKISKSTGDRKIAKRLSDDQVREIRKLNETMSYRQIAKKFNTTHSYIGRVIRRDIYKDVK